jgi:hypothetical protein
MHRYKWEFVTLLVARLAVVVGFRVFTARRSERVIALPGSVMRVKLAFGLVWHLMPTPPTALVAHTVDADTSIAVLTIVDLARPTTYDAIFHKYFVAVDASSRRRHNGANDERVAICNKLNPATRITLFNR